MVEILTIILFAIFIHFVSKDKDDKGDKVESYLDWCNSGKTPDEEGYNP